MVNAIEFVTWLATCWRPPQTGAALFASADVTRDFLRCDGCGRVFMHYWACKPAAEPGRIGCVCGGKQARTTLLPEWQAAYYVLSRYVVRKLLLRRTYWDPRLPGRTVMPDA